MNYIRPRSCCRSCYPLVQGLGLIFIHIFGILVEQRVVLHDQKAMVVLPDGHELEDCESAAHLQLGEVAIQPAEDAKVVAADVENLVTLQIEIAVQRSD